MSVKKQSFTIRTYTAINIKRKEAALNGKVVRIHVTRLSNAVMDLKLRGLKRKRSALSSSAEEEIKVLQQQGTGRKRGRPRKFNFEPKGAQIRRGEEEMKAVTGNKRGRPRKFNFEPKITRDMQTKIVGKNLRDRKLKVSARTPEKIAAIVKAKHKLTAPSKVTTRSSTSSTGGDEVISFLPVFNHKPKSPMTPYNKKKYPSFSNKEGLSPGNPVVILGSDFSSVIHEKSKKTTPIDSPKRDIPNATVNSVNKSEEAAPQNEIDSKENKKVVSQKSKSNGSVVDRKSEKTYAVFVNEDNNNKYTESSTVGEIDFNKLVRSLKQVKLPGPKWKIRIVVSKMQTITEVTFTNKEEYERCIKFSRMFTGYIITFDKVHIKLFGAPTKITTFNDVTILLDIIHNISLNDVLLEYEREEKIVL